MAKTQFFGGKLKVTEEVAKQHGVVAEGMAKLTDMSQRGWHLIEDGCYKREMLNSALLGGTCVVVAIRVTKTIKKLWKKHKDKQEPESE